MAYYDYIIGPLIVLGASIFFIALTKLTSRRAKTKRYRSKRYSYVPGEFSGQLELDLRLPYRRFKQLYPSTKLTYEEYKKLQMQRAFRRSLRSQDNKRMVR